MPTQLDAQAKTGAEQHAQTPKDLHRKHGPTKPRVQQRQEDTSRILWWGNTDVKAQRAAAKAAGTPGTTLGCPIPIDSHLIPEHCNHRGLPNWHFSHCFVCCFFFFKQKKSYLFYIISSVAQRRMGSSCFLDVGTMLHLTSHRTSPCRSPMSHFSQC